MDFVPTEHDALYAIVHELVVGSAGAVPITLLANAALLRASDQFSHMLLVRSDVDRDWVKTRMRELRQHGLEVLLVGGTAEDRQALISARPAFTLGGMHIMHLGEDGTFWAERLGLGAYHGPLGRYLRSGARGSVAPSWEQFGERAAQTAAIVAQQTSSFAQQLAAQRPIATVVLAVLIGAVFALQVAYHATDQVSSLIRMGALVASRVQAGEIWRLVSCTFLHAGTMHVALNVLVLLAIGLQLERMIGSSRYLLVYVVSALCGSLASMTLTKAASVGASGALWGIMAAQFVLAWRSKDVLPQQLQAAVLRSAAQNLALNLMNSFRPGVDWAAHLGGGLAGGAVMFAMVATLPRVAAASDRAPADGARTGRPPAWLRALAALAGVVLVAGLGIGLVRGQFWRAGGPPRFHRVEMAGSGLTVEIPEQLELRQTITDTSKKLEFVYGDILDDPVVVDVIVVPMQVPAGDMDGAYAETKVALDKAPWPDGGRSAGLAAERRIGGRRVIDKHYDFGNGVALNVMVEITAQGFRRVEFVRRSELDTQWEAVAERALLSIAPSSP